METLVKSEINEEFYRKEVNKLLNREENKKMKIVYIMSSLFFASIGYKFTIMEPLIDEKIFLNIPENRNVTTLKNDIPKPVEKKEPVKKTPKETKKVTTIKQVKQIPTKSITGGGGSPQAKTTNRGIFSAMSSIKSSVKDADPFGQGGFTTGLDAILSGKGGLKKGGGSGIQRASAGGIGFNTGINSGTVGGHGNMENLVAGIASSTSLVKHKPRGIITPTLTANITGDVAASGRSKEEIRLVVMKRIGGLKYLYNKYLKTNPDLAGKITVKMVISPGGTVIRAVVLESSLNLTSLEREIVARIKGWNFGKVTKGDATVIYPFNFAS